MNSMRCHKLGLFHSAYISYAQANLQPN